MAGAEEWLSLGGAHGMRRSVAGAPLAALGLPAPAGTVSWRAVTVSGDSFLPQVHWDDNDNDDEFELLSPWGRLSPDRNTL